MSIQDKIDKLQLQIDTLTKQLTGDLGSNDKILIEINGLMIEQHKQESFIKLGLI